MPKFEITKGKHDDFLFSLIANNGDVILTGGGYSSKEDCKNGIESVRRNSVLRDHYERSKGAAHKFHFDLKAENGEVIGRSKLFETEPACLATINLVMSTATNAALVDTTKNH